MSSLTETKEPRRDNRLGNQSYTPDASYKQNSSSNCHQLDCSIPQDVKRGTAASLTSHSSCQYFWTSSSSSLFSSHLIGHVFSIQQPSSSFIWHLLLIPCFFELSPYLVVNPLKTIWFNLLLLRKHWAFLLVSTFSLQYFPLYYLHVPIEPISLKLD